MRRILVTALLSLFLFSGSGLAYADNHRGGDHDKGRKEQRFDKKRPNGKKDNDHKHLDKKPNNKKHYNKFDKKRPDRPPGNVGKINRIPPKPIHKPTPPPAPAYRPRHYNHAYHYPHYSIHDNLSYMVSKIVRGGRDVDVWQVDEGTYVVRFRRGNRLYTQYLYPYEGRYGNLNTISVDWAPLSPWSLIPSVHLNINI